MYQHETKKNKRIAHIIAFLLGFLLYGFGNLSAFADNTVVKISTVDELLNAIAPNTTIQLEDGVYNLSASSYYSRAIGGKYFYWRNIYDGYELVISGVDNLTLLGTHDEFSIISAEPRYANVLNFEDCSNISVCKMTIGHTEEPGNCAGGVLNLCNCSDVSVRDCRLYGCGILALSAVDCTSVAVDSTSMYDCSFGAVDCMGCYSMSFTNCSIFHCGFDDYSQDVLRFMSSDDISVCDCNISENKGNSVLNAGYSRNVFFLSNVVQNNQLNGGMFLISREGTVIDGCLFEGNTMEAWYSGEGSFATDLNRKQLNSNDFSEMYYQKGLASDIRVSDVSEENQKSIELEIDENGYYHVSTVDELLKAIHPDTTIILEPGTYYLSDAMDYGFYGREYYSWMECYDGMELVINGCSNLTITGNPDCPESVTIVAGPRYANVLSFHYCDHLTLQGFTAGHSQAPGECTGGVLSFSDCGNTLVDHCRMYGCGVYGIETAGGYNMQVTDSEIYDCTYGGLYIYDTDKLSFTGCIIHDVEGPDITFMGMGERYWNGNRVENGNFDLNEDGTMSLYVSEW